MTQVNPDVGDTRPQAQPQMACWENFQDICHPLLACATLTETNISDI